MRLAIVNAVWDRQLERPAALLDRCTGLTGWADAVRDAGCDPVVVCQRFGMRGDVGRVGVTYRFRPDGGLPSPGLSFDCADGTCSAVTAARPDVVHVNGVGHPALVRRLRSLLPRRVAIVLQDRAGLDPAGLPPFRRTALRRGLSVADALIVSSRARVDVWRLSGLVPDELVLGDVIQASTTMAPLKRDEARRASGVDGSPALLWVGGLDAIQDPITVLRGFAGFAGRLPTARLTMVYGTADLVADVRREMARMPAVASRVRLVALMSQDALAAHYSAADVFVQGSRNEGNVHAVIDAMACGAIPVVTDTASLRALTGGGRVGALWTPGEPQSLADALAHVAARPTAREREAVRARFQSTLTWRAIGVRAVEIYRQAVEARVRTSAAGGSGKNASRR